MAAAVTGRDLPGAELARKFFTCVVEPLLSQAAPGLGCAAARLGSGLDVLGLDDEMSRDNDWGCRLTLLVDEDARDQAWRDEPLARFQDRWPTCPEHQRRKHRQVYRVAGAS
jgi:hypothetical protein